MGSILKLNKGEYWCQVATKLKLLNYWPAPNDFIAQLVKHSNIKQQRSLSLAEPAGTFSWERERVSPPRELAISKISSCVTLRQGKLHGGQPTCYHPSITCYPAFTHYISANLTWIRVLCSMIMWHAFTMKSEYSSFSSSRSTALCSTLTYK